MPTKSEQAAKTANEYYNLIAVLYHMLEGATTYEEYAQDAEQQGDSELTEFFRKAQQQNADCAHQAQKLLANRIK